MEEKFIIAHDLGTTNNKAALVRLDTEVVGRTISGYEVSYPHPGYAEQSPEDWWNAIIKTTRELLETTNIPPAQIAGIVFSAQMACTLPVDSDGEALAPAMIWLDARASSQAEDMLGGPIKVEGYNVFSLIRFLRITGGGPGHAGKDPISKILWIKENEPRIYEKTHKFLGPQDYLIYRCTGDFMTSRDNANVSWLMDTRPGKFCWSDALLKRYGIEERKLPKIMKSTDVAGKLTSRASYELGLCEGLPLVVGAGDMASAAIGSGAVKENHIHACIGTSDWLACHVSKRKKDIRHYIGAICGADPEMYLCVAEQESAGVCLDWIKNQMYHREEVREEEKVEELYQLFDRMVKDANPGASNLIFTPWLYGERAPIDDHSVRGGFHNLGLNHSREDLLRAVFEGVAFNMKWALIHLEKLTQRAEFINIIGGGAKSDIWCQIISDVLDRRINQVHQPQEAGCRGAAMIAAIGLGYLDDFSKVEEMVKIKNTFIPNEKNRRLYDDLFDEFRNIYTKNKDIYARLNV